MTTRFVTMCLSTVFACGPNAEEPLVDLEGEAASALLARGKSYVFDDFSNAARSSQIWNFGSCSAVPHQAPNGSYPTFGQAIRRGECRQRTEGTAAFMRFTTHPFDRRDATLDGTDNFADTVDVRKGGSEMRGNRSFVWDGSAEGTGWDFLGTTFLAPTNTVRFTWDFRVTDLSILTGRPAMAKGAFIGQLHTQKQPECLRAPGDTAVDGLSPNPGLHLAIDPTDATQALLTLHVKLRAREVPAGFTTKPSECATSPLPDKWCQVDVWQRRIDVQRLTNTWYRVSLVTRASSSTGTLAFLFGERDGGLQPYERQQFLDGSTQLSGIATSQNSCPNVPFLGAYVLGYPASHYGYGPDDAPIEGSLLRVNSTAITPNFRRLFSPFFDGQQMHGAPPALTIDYDNFRIVQQ